MSLLTPVVYYTIPRNEEGARESIHDRAFILALRWEPLPEYDPNGVGVDPELVEHGRRHLNRLMQGDAVSGEHMRRAHIYLLKAIDYYSADPWEPYPGRNGEAVVDLRMLVELVAL